MSDFKVQRGTVTIVNGSTTATITAGSQYTAPASITKAFIRITTHNGHTTGDSLSDTSGVPGRNTAYISNPGNLLTSITFSRNDANTTTSTGITWEIIEYIGADGGPNEVIFRDVGAAAFVSADTTISGTTGVTNADPADVVVFLTGVGFAGGARGNSGSYNWTTAFNSTTDAAELTRSLTGNSGNVSYCVAEFTGSNWSVQRATHSQTTAGVETEAITSVGDMSRAFIHVQHRVNVNGGPRNMAHEVYLSAVNELTFDLDYVAASTTRDFVVWVVSNSATGDGAMSVARYNGSRAADTGSEPDTFTHAITTVADLEQTSIMGECTNCGATVSSEDAHGGMLGFFFVTDSFVGMSRGRHRNVRDYRFEVVQWPSTPAGGAVLPSPLLFGFNF